MKYLYYTNGSGHSFISCDSFEIKGKKLKIVKPCVKIVFDKSVERPRIHSMQSQGTKLVDIINYRKIADGEFQQVWKSAKKMQKASKNVHTRIIRFGENMKTI